MVAFDIIIPIYQVHPTILRECLESVCNQTHQDWHCYVVDGTPTDWKHIEEHQTLIREILDKEQDRFTYSIQSGTGVSQARNQVIKCGQSPYLAFLDGDDYWFPNHLSVIADAIQETTKERQGEHAVIWFTNLRNQIVVPSENGTFEVTIQNEINAYRSLIDCPIHRQYWYFCHSPLWTTSVVVTREAFERTGGFDESLTYCEDVECWIRMIGVPQKPDYGCPSEWGYATHVDQTTAFHREHANAMTESPQLTDEGDYQTPPLQKQQVADAIIEGIQKWTFDYLPCPLDLDGAQVGMSTTFWQEVLDWFEEGDAKGYRVLNTETEMTSGQWDHLVNTEDDDDLEAHWNDS